MSIRDLGSNKQTRLKQLSPAVEAGTSDSVPTMMSAPFRRERDLVASMSEAIPQLLRLRHNQHVRVLTEVPIGTVIPDMLIGVWGSQWPPEDLGLTYVEAHILAEVERHGPIDVVTLRSRIHLTDTAATRALARLEKVRAVARRRTGQVYARRKHPLGKVEVVAIEAKLRRWRDALRQARAYQSFANRSFVVLDESQVRNEPEMLEAFNDASVGLWLRTTVSTAQAVAAPRLEPRTADRLQALQKLAQTEHSQDR